MRGCSAGHATSRMRVACFAPSSGLRSPSPKQPASRRLRGCRNLHEYSASGIAEAASSLSYDATPHAAPENEPVQARRQDHRHHRQSKSKSKVAKPKEPKAKSPATEALKALQQCGLRSETIAHRVAALMTGKQPDAEHLSNASIEKQALLSAQLVLSNAEALVPKIAAKVNDEVTRHHEVIACEIKTVGAAASMKLIPTHRNLHRHVAVLLPEYNAAYHYKQRVSGLARRRGSRSPSPGPRAHDRIRLIPCSLLALSGQLLHAVRPRRLLLEDEPHARRGERPTLPLLVRSLRNERTSSILLHGRWRQEAQMCTIRRAR